ncbi:MAG TPA: sulfotransferase [Gemmatimonadota bacterium]|nr:sulfotransferase [Gemmatimonadota bacterium]
MSADNPPRMIGFRFTRLRRKLVHRLRRRLLRDDGRELPTLLVAGTARSGTTWLAEILARATRSRLMFEPLAPQAVPTEVQIPLFPCPRPDELQPALEAHLRRVFDGQIRDPWIDKQPVTCHPRARLVKSVRASFMLGWLARAFPDLVIVFVTRDPWSVVRSRIDVGWDPGPDLQALLAQPSLLESLAPLGDRVRAASERIEHGDAAASEIIEANAVLWAIANHVAHSDLEEISAIHVRYEALRANPVDGFGRLIDEIAARGAFDVGQAERALRSVRRPSMTSRAIPPTSGREPFARRFGEQAADGVAEIAEAFGLGWTLEPPAG